MTGEDLAECIGKRPGVDQLGLLGVSPVAFDSTHTPAPAS